MIPSDAVGLFAGAILLGIVHGVEPGHGWPVAASYALDQTNKWLYGFAASFILGLGHLVSSIAMVVVFFLAKQYFELTQVNEPIPIDIFSTTIFLGGPVSLFAGVLLVGLGIREYFHGHSHDHGGDGHDHSHGHGGDHDHSHDESDGQRYHVGATPDYAGSHDHDAHEHESHDHPHGHDDDHSHGHDEHGHRHSHDHSHSHDHADDDSGVLAKLKLALPFVGGHSHGSAEDASERGLWGIAGFAFVLGFAHEEEFEIIAMCAGSEYCLSLMTVYALTVIAGIVALTLLLIAGYEHYEERVERYTDYLPLFSAVVLILMGLGFIAGLF